MKYTTASIEEIESVMPDEYGGMWFFRDALDCSTLGITLLELEPGSKGKPHDHSEDEQEEDYLVLSGELTVEIGDPTAATEVISAGEAIRVEPETWRAISNEHEEVTRVVIAGSA